MNMGNTYVRSMTPTQGLQLEGTSLIDHLAKPDLVAPGNRVSRVRSGASLATKPLKFGCIPCDTTGNMTTERWADINTFACAETSMVHPRGAGAARFFLMVSQKGPPSRRTWLKARMMQHP